MGKIKGKADLDHRNDSMDSLAGAFLQQTRLGILRKLREKGRSYIGELEGELDITRATLCYHLDILEEVELVEQEYELIVKPQSRKGKVRSYYRLNEEKLTEVTRLVTQLIPPSGR